MTSTAERPVDTAGMVPAADWLTCDNCDMLLYRRRFERLLGVCPECGWHSRLTVQRRLDTLLDPGSVTPVPVPDTADDPLSFVDSLPYVQRLDRARAATGLRDAVRVVKGRIHGRRVVVAAMDFRFLGGSLGCAAGAAVATAAATALAERTPLLIVTASGGARMQEGALALMQMAKTANAMRELDEAGILTVTLVTDPTYGGVAASFATLSDVVVAESGARMGFAGPRVIAQTIRQELPAGFQTAAFLLAHGLVDDVRTRAELPYVLGQLLAAAGGVPAHWRPDVADPVCYDPELLEPQPVERAVRLARHLQRPTTTDHLGEWADGFVELHGDRLGGGDCPAIVGGLATVDGLPLVVIGHQKGHTTDELVRRNFGMPSPAGYRKAVRLMRLAAKLRIPVVTLVDTPGAHPGLHAEEQGQSAAIAEAIACLGALPVPVVTVITGEGGSGGALALAVADRVLLTGNGIYSVISPEGCAAILWRGAEHAPAAAAALRLDARSLLRAGIVDGVVPEPPGGAHQQPGEAARLVHAAVTSALRQLLGYGGAELVASRRARFRRFGQNSSTAEEKPR